MKTIGRIGKGRIPILMGPVCRNGSHTQNGFFSLFFNYLFSLLLTLPLIKYILSIYLSLFFLAFSSIINIYLYFPFVNLFSPCLLFHYLHIYFPFNYLFSPLLHYHYLHVYFPLIIKHIIFIYLSLFFFAYCTIIWSWELRILVLGVS